MNANITTPRLTIEEVARECFAAGYHHAIDHVVALCGIPESSEVIQSMRAAAADARARAAIAKATGGRP